MIRRPLGSQPPSPPLPYPTVFRSHVGSYGHAGVQGKGRARGMLGNVSRYVLRQLRQADQPRQLTGPPGFALAKEQMTPGHAGQRIDRNVASDCQQERNRSEEHTSELQSLMRISYAVFCLKKKTTNKTKVDEAQANK